MSKTPHSEPHYIQGLIDLQKIDPSPHQHRRHFDEDKLRELAASIQREGLIEPIVLRPKRDRYELIAGERRFRAVRDFTEMETIQAQIIIAGDLQARRISAAENMQREDLSAIETIEAIVEIVDAELIEDKEYASMGKKPADRVKVLLGKLHSITNSKDRGSKVSKENEALLNKFVQQVEKIFKNLPKSLEWRSFFNHDLNLIVETGQEVRDVAIRHKLSKSQARALQKLSRASKSRFDSFIQESGISGKNKDRSDKPSPSKRGLKEFSAAEIEAIAEKEIEKQALAEQERLRETIPLVSKVKVLLMSRLGIPVEIIASNLRINWKTAQKYGQDTGLFETVRKSLGDGLSVPIVTKKHALPEPLVWSVALEGKIDQDRFDALGWKIRPWDYWYWNNCDRRFGDDWPGRIPAQMVGHILYYFSDQDDLVLDPIRPPRLRESNGGQVAGGGVVADTCLAFNRRCWSFDMDDRPDTRPEIEPYFWDITNLVWPIKGKTKPDLIIFDPPYFKKQSNNYDPDGISGLSKEKYLEFLESFFSLAHLNAKKSTQMAFINADWRDFQNTPAKNETRVNSILINDYLRILNQSGWQETHIFQAPLSSERFKANVVSAMQKRKIIGVTSLGEYDICSSRYVIISKKK